MDYCCDMMKSGIENNNVIYDDGYDEFGIPDGNNLGVYRIIHRCPYCNSRLPESDKLNIYKKNV